MSAILSADDLNDFISPGVACIKPIETLPNAEPDEHAANENEVILDGTQAPIKTTAPAEISLTDCLACSGCVTSAEAVLVSLQSHAEVLSVLDSAPALQVSGPDKEGKYHVQGLENENAKLFVASVSPQSRASLAAACGAGVTERQAGIMVENLLKGSSGLPDAGQWKNGFQWVFDTNVTRQIGLVLGADEVLQQQNLQPSTPILASSCPGWVCYAEKTHPYVLPHLSKVKSPQALMGTLIKTTLSRKLKIPPSRIWHLTVMPCFDKKLEASREELTDEVWAGSGQPGRGVRDVDCVITSKEILMLAEARSVSFFDMAKTLSPACQTSLPFPDTALNTFLFPREKRHNPLPSAGSSGGQLYHILKTKASQIPGSEIMINRGRNADVVEYSVVVNGETVVRAARYYGFRNIQNLVRRLKPSRPSRMPGGKPFGSSRRPTGKQTSMDYSYVEVMACPGGCTNGGGQIKVDDPIIIERKALPPKPGPQEQKDWLAEVDEAYFSGEETQASDEATSHDIVDGISHSYIHNTLAYWSDFTGIGLQSLAFTSYREVISDVGKDATETEKVVQLAGKIGGGW